MTLPATAAERAADSTAGVHALPASERAVLIDVGDWMADRLADRASEAWVAARTGAPVTLPAIGEDGIGTAAAWAVLRDRVLPTAFPTDHPRYLAFVGGAATPAAVLADAALSAAAVYGGSELEAGAVVDAERAAMRWLCELVGFGDAAHGTFTSGGSLANLSALVAARHGRLAPDGRPPSVIVAGASAHASVRSAAAIMGCTVVLAGSPDAALDGPALATALAALDPADVVAVVATAGATNTGIVDRLDEVAGVCADRGLWLHVDAAYGGAALLSVSRRRLFAGIERADSVTIDPHKWLFTPLDCGAVLYRDADRARAAHRQTAAYLDAVNDEAADNPADYAVHLTRRARGVPLWMSLVANGSDEYSVAVDRCIATAEYAAKWIERSEDLELVMDPELSVVLFRRRGWSDADYAQWSRRMREGALALVTPTMFAGETVLRFCVVNPLTSEDDMEVVLASLTQAGTNLGVPATPLDN